MPGIHRRPGTIYSKSAMGPASTEASLATRIDVGKRK